MNSVLKSKREAERLEVLSRLQILGSVSESEYDEITFLAANIFQTPIALISFIDEKRQWFKSSYGMIGLTELPRHLSICSHTILQDEHFVISDVKNDPQFFEHSILPGGRKIGFYAGFSILDPEKNLPIGTISVIDYVSRKLSKEQIQSLGVLKNQVQRLLQLRLKLRDSMISSLGEISAGVAHEINNPLAIVCGLLPLLQKEKNDEDKFKLKIEMMAKSLLRITKIVSGLRRFSGSPDFEIEKKLFPISEVLKNVLMMTEIKAKKFDTKITVHLESSPFIECDEIEIEQVFINIINNSMDAIKLLEDKWIKIHVFEDDNQAVVQVIDSGHGLTKEIESKLFQPFFTTKKVGEGTGLGLSICRGILENHQAKIEINKKMKNTCFEVRFKNQQKCSAV